MQKEYSRGGKHHEPTDHVILSGHASVKYWLGDRDAKEVLTGWNIGLYGGVGKYDLQLFDKDGEQGDFFDAGLLPLTLTRFWQAFPHGV